MAPVVVLTAGRRIRLTVQRAAAPAAVLVVDRAAVLRAAATAAGVRLVVSELRDRVGADTIPALAALAARTGAPAILACAPIDDRAVDDVFALAVSAAMARAGLVLDGVDDLAAAVRGALAGWYAPSAALPVLERIAELVPRELRAFLLLAAARSAPGFTVTRASMLLGMTRRTLERRLARAGFPRASRIIQWCTALRVGWRLDVLGQRPSDVRAALGFASRSAMSNVVRRHGGRPATALRVHGGFVAMRERFAAELGTRRSEAR